MAWIAVPLVALVVAGLAFALRRPLSASRPTKHSTALVPIAEAEHSNGATVPWSTGPVLRADVLQAIQPTRTTSELVAYGDPGPSGDGFVLEIITSLRTGDLPLPATRDLPAVSGPIARAVQALAGSEGLVRVAMGKAGFAVVKMPPGTKWMVANGQQVAQALGKGGQAGARAPIVGLATASVVAPQLIVVGAALTAEYLLVAKIEQGVRVASLIHQRQVSEALAAGDAARALVERTRNWSDDAREWPEVLVRELVDCHAELKRQGHASIRLRDLVLTEADAPAENEKSRPARPGSGDVVEARTELIAGYEVHASAAQVAAARLEHALAHGDRQTAAVLSFDLVQHLGDLKDHHSTLMAVSEQRERVLKRKWGSTIKSITDGYAPLVEHLESGGQFLLTEGSDGTPQLLALPPGSLDAGLPTIPSADVDLVRIEPPAQPDPTDTPTPDGD